MAEQETSPDVDLPLKKRARRRLVGAAVLALFAVIVLPMVMDREPRPLSQDIQVRIPSQDSTGLAAKVLPEKTAATPMPAPEPKPVVAASAPVKESPIPEKVNPVPEKVSPAPAAKVSSPAAVALAEKPAATKEADAKAKVDASAEWVVQLGAYKEAGNVKLLLAKLKGIGVPAYTEKLESPQGARTRVRAGPFASRDAADKARSRIKIIGVDGPVAPK
jgi:DedD protein